MDSQFRQVENIIKTNPWHLECLRAVRSLNLPDWAIGAGFVRNLVWDHLQGYTEMTPLNDIDVLYFDPQQLDPAKENDLEQALQDILPDRPWSVRNQARMHLRNGDEPYTNTENALCYWLETPTCVAVRLADNDGVSLVAPFGLEDLLTMKIRPTPRGLEKFHEYSDRIEKKQWHKMWPKSTVDDTAIIE